MKKRFIALFMIFTMLIVFATPMTSEAAWPWWERNKHIVKADAIGALTGAGGGWVGALIGGALGSLKAGINGGEGAGGWEPPKDVEASIGLHHNLALKYVIGDRKLSELDENEIEEGLLNYANQFTKDDNDMKIIRMMLSGEDVPQLKTSDNFQMDLDMAMKILDGEGNPRDLVGKTVDYLREKAADIPLDQIDGEIEKRMDTGRNMDDIAYMITADVLEHSFEFWSDKYTDLDDDNDGYPLKRDGGLLRKLWKIVKADIDGAIDGYDSGGVEGAILQGAINSTSQGINNGAGQGNWEEENIYTIGSFHNKALTIGYGAEDMERAISYFLKENDIDLPEEVINNIRACNDPDGCIRNPILDWLNGKEKTLEVNVTHGFTESLQSVMEVAFAEKDFNAEEVKLKLEKLLDDAAIESGAQFRILALDEYKALETKLNQENKPLDIIYASIFVDMYLHSTAYWLGEEGPVKSTSYILDIRDILENKIEISLNIGSDEATINSEVQMMDVIPVVRNQRVLVPFRFIGEALNAEINWIQENQEATYELGDMKLSLFIDETRILVNGEEKEMDVKPLVINQRILVPIRVISETLGFEVEWIQEEQEVRVFNK